MRITIFFGGTNKERLVSVASAQALHQALPEADLWFWDIDDTVHEVRSEALPGRGGDPRRALDRGLRAEVRGSVTGVVAPDQVLTNATGRAGDALVLTKPLGAGTVSTAVKRGIAGAPLAEAVEVMTTLNRDAAAAARAAGVHALTDVTGFGLLGHLYELASASGLAAEVDADAVPAIDGVLEPLSDPDESAIAGGTRRNRAYAEEFTSVAADVPEARRWLVCDAMTSGGLLAALPEERAGEVPGAVIGRLVEGPPGAIAVR